MKLQLAHGMVLYCMHTVA